MRGACRRQNQYRCLNALTLGLEAPCLERVSKPWRFCSECLQIKSGTLRVVLCILEPRTPKDELCTGAATQSATLRAEQDHSHRIWGAGRVQRLAACLCLSPVRRALCWPCLCAESGHLGSHMSRCHSKGCTYLHVCVCTFLNVNICKCVNEYVWKCVSV